MAPLLLPPRRLPGGIISWGRLPPSFLPPGAYQGALDEAEDLAGEDAEWQGRQPLLHRSRWVWWGGGRGEEWQVGAVEGMEQGWGEFGLRGGSSVNWVGSGAPLSSSGSVPLESCFIITGIFRIAGESVTCIWWGGGAAPQN